MNQTAYKVVIMGATSVGKSSIVRGMFYGNNNFREFEYTTIGAAFHSRKIDHNVRLDFWDTAGQERFDSMLKLYYREADIIVFVFDMSDCENSVKKVKKLLSEIRYADEDVEFIIVGNKSDLVTKEEEICVNNYVTKVVGDNKIISLINTSAKTFHNIDLLSDTIVGHITNKHKLNPKNKDKAIINLSTNNSKKYWFYSYC